MPYGVVTAIARIARIVSGVTRVKSMISLPLESGSAYSSGFLLIFFLTGWHSCARCEDCEDCQ